MSETERWEPYRVVLDYEALHDGFNDRIEDLCTTLEQIDMAGGFAKGNAQKLLCRSTGRSSRTFGRESLGKMLKATGLAIVLVVDDERFAAVREQLEQRRKPRKPAIARIDRPAWLINKENAREMGKKRWRGLTDLQRSRLARRAAKARWRAVAASKRQTTLVCDQSAAK